MTNELINIVIECIRKSSSYTGPINEDTTLRGLGLDSLAIIGIIFEIERRLDIDILTNANDGAIPETVGALADLVGRCIDRQ